VAPILGETPGLSGTIGVTDYATGKVYVIQFFKGEEDADKFYSSGMIQDFTSIFRESLSNVTSIEDYKVMYLWSRDHPPQPSTEEKK
jgi:hypothetical protein